VKAAQRRKLQKALDRETLDRTNIVQIHYLEGGNISVDTLTIVEEYPEGKGRIRHMQVFNQDGTCLLDRETVLYMTVASTEA
jgi:hypothetical protein